MPDFTNAIPSAATPRRPNTQLLPTLFDRLIDQAPSRQSEAADEYAVNRNRMREIIQRDLTLLLNTTNRADEIDQKKYPLISKSVLNFGVSAFAGNHISSIRWENVEKIIREAICAFEPRIVPETLQIIPLNDHQRQYNNLSFAIHGHVHMQPYPMEFTVQSTLDMESSRISFEHR